MNGLPVYQPVNNFKEGVTFTCFNEVSAEELLKVVRKSKPTTCPSDPIPSTLIKDNITTLLPIITRIVNNSLQSGNFSEQWKNA